MVRLRFHSLFLIGKVIQISGRPYLELPCSEMLIISLMSGWEILLFFVEWGPRRGC